MTAREAILQRLRDAAGPAVPLPEVKPLSLPAADLVSLFVERAASVGTEIATIRTEMLASTVLGDLIRAKVSRVAVWDDPLLVPVHAALRETSIQILDPRNHHTAEVAACDAGLTTSEFAIALTGTLALGSSPQHPRSTSLLPPLHLAVVPADRVVGTLGDVLARTGTLPSALTFITGPSRTADIELTPVRGAHGPTAVKVYLLV